MNELVLIIIKIISIILGLTIIAGSIYPEKSKYGELYHKFIIGISIILAGGNIYFIWKSNKIIEIVIAFLIFILSGYIVFNEFEKNK